VSVAPAAAHVQTLRGRLDGFDARPCPQVKAAGNPQGEGCATVIPRQKSLAPQKSLAWRVKHKSPSLSIPIAVGSAASDRERRLRPGADCSRASPLFCAATTKFKEGKTCLYAAGVMVGSALGGSGGGVRRSSGQGYASEGAKHATCTREKRTPAVIRPCLAAAGTAAGQV
jgi:hypothetical protein